MEVKLTDMTYTQYVGVVKADYNTFANNPNLNWLAAEFTQKEFSKLLPIKQQIANALPREQFVAGLLPPDRLEGLYSSENLGYLSPEKVRRYFVSKLDEEFEGGLLHQVTIDFEDSWQYDRIGTYTYLRPQVESKVPIGIKPVGKGHAYEYKGNTVLEGTVFLDDEIAIEFVTEDRSGRFITISDEWIGSLIYNAKNWAQDIHVYSTARILYTLEKAEKLAKASGNRDLVEVVDEAWEHCKSLIATDPIRHRERLEQRTKHSETPSYKVELDLKLGDAWEIGMEVHDPRYISRSNNSKNGRAMVDPNALSIFPYGGVVHDIASLDFPFSLEGISRKAVLKLITYFRELGFDAEYMEKNMKIKQLK